MNYKLSGLVYNEIIAREVCSLLENLAPKPLGSGFTELCEKEKIWEVDIYFNYKPDLSVKLLLEKIYETEFLITKIQHKDWIENSERALIPIEVSNIFIHGIHDRKKISINKKNIEIQAAMAFGTGHHSSTKLCILLYHGLVKKGFFPRNILDIGCGTGILSIIASKFGKSRIMSVDIDQIAVDTAKHNLIKNNVSYKCLVKKSDGFYNYNVKTRSKFDLIFANILFQPLQKMVKEVNKHLVSQGHIILSGISLSQAIKLKAIYSGHGFKIIESLREGSWNAIVMQKCKKKFIQIFYLLVIIQYKM